MHNWLYTDWPYLFVHKILNERRNNIYKMRRKKKQHNNQSKEFELQVIITNNKIDWVGVSNICTKCTVTSRRPASFIMLINSRWLKIKSHLCGSLLCILSSFQNLFLSFLFDFFALFLSSRFSYLFSFYRHLYRANLIYITRKKQVEHFNRILNSPSYRW